MPRLLPLLFLLAASGSLGCAGVDEAGDRPARPARTDGVLTVAPSDDRVRTIQLHPTGREAALPVVALGSGQTLTLAFDLIDDGRGGPVSVFFYHFDRHWNRRLSPIEYQRGFQTDDIRDYRPSAGTRVRFTHYRYEFPNPTIEFTRSGNFVVRVTELGDEQAVLFEQPFFLSEEIAEVDFGLHSGLGSGLGGPFRQPVADVRPAPRYDSPIFQHDVCFARDGRVAVFRCAEEPRLTASPFFRFFLPENRAFTSAAPRHVLDLSILGAGPGIAGVDLGRSPFRVTLVPDNPRVESGFMTNELLGGQPLVGTGQRTVFDQGTGAEYVETHFTMLPPEGEPLAGRVLLTGAFNQWRLDRRWAMAWNAAKGVYEGTFLIKQGRYAYAYHIEDPAEQRRQQALNPLSPSLYTAFVYLHEPTFRTDRLVAVQNVIGQ